MVLGISVPPPSYSERKFVTIWVGAIVAFAGAGVLFFLLIAKMYKF